MAMGRGLLGCLPEIFVDSNLDAHTPPLGVVNILVLPDAPAVSPELFSGLNDHVADQFPLLHEGSAQGLGTGPRLGAAAVQVYAAGEGSHEGRCSCEFLWHVGTELDYCWRLGPVGGYCEV